MRSVARFSFALVAAAHLSSAQAQNADDELKVYAVNVVKTPPLEKQFTGYGILSWQWQGDYGGSCCRTLAGVDASPCGDWRP